jgi:putative endopeptidase
MNAKLTTAVLTASLTCACANKPPAQPAEAPPPVAPAGILQSGVYAQNFDKSVRPQDDFYRYVNGQWLAKTEIPADRSNYGAFTLLEEGAERDLHTIVEEAAQAGAAAGTDKQKVGDFYASFMDEAAVDQRGLAPLREELARIDALKSKKDVAGYIGHSQRIFVSHPFAYFVAIDEKHSSEYVGVVFQSGLGMPDRDYYLSDDARLKGVREKYRVYVKDLLAAADTPNASAAAEKIFGLESKLAAAHWTRVQNRDAEKTYNRYDLAALGKLMPSFDWNAFLAGANVPLSKVKAVVVTQPSYFEALDKVVGDVPVADWRTYFRYKLLNTYAPDLPAKFVNLHFEFNDRTVSGIEEIKPRWKRGVDTVENAIGDLAGKMYVERYFRADAKRRVDQLVGNLKTAFSQGIDTLEWMTPATKQKAHAKLALFTTKIGYPEKWRDWSKLEVRRDDLIGNEMRAAAVVFDRGVDKLGGPIDKTEWFMTPQTVNAYYNPPSNEIVFPAAILRPPFFNVAADDAVNYGAIGAVIGHEISHGFDDQGRRYDGTGNLNDWWAPQDNDEFTRRTKLLGAQYNALSPIPGMKVNGDLTMGENIADLAGLALAYRAYQVSLQGKPAPVIDGYTGDQRFFIGWAQGWARKYREDELRKRLLTDPHSPSEFRTNAVVVNLPEFYRAFDVKAGDKMYRAPAERVRIW